MPLLMPSRSHRTPPFRRGGVSLAAAVALISVPAALGAAQPARAAEAAAAPAATGWVRAAHLVPGLGTMSIGLTPFSGDTSGGQAEGDVAAAPSRDGMRVLAPAASYGGVSGYLQVPVGYYTVTVRPADAPADSTPLVTGTLRAEADKAYTVAGLGSKADPSLTVLPDDLTPPAAGSSRVRLLPAASAAPAVTVVAHDGPTVAQDAAFGRPTGYAEVPAGTWTLRARATAATGPGAGSGAGGTADPAVSRVSLDPGSVYTLLVLDRDGALKVQPVLDAASAGQMPAGGAQTGGGGLAAVTYSDGEPTGTARDAVLLAVVLGAGAALGRARVANWRRASSAARGGRL